MPRLLLLFFLVTTHLFAADSGSDARAPLAIYLTWKHDPTSTMAIQWLTSAATSEDFIEYHSLIENDLNPSPTWKKVKGKHKALPEGHDDLLIHTAELCDLQPATMYIFRIPTLDEREYKFKTMPKTLEDPIRFVVGGDIYHDKIAIVEEMNKVAADTDPMFAVLGGDIAYASNQRWWACWDDCERWLTFLRAWTKTMVTADGRLIPLLPTIGNHDVQGGYNQTPGQAPFFYALFPMPGFKGFNVVDFGDYMSLFLLDSGHTHPIAEEQTAWLEISLKKRQKVPNKFAAYHVGAYPSYRAPGSSVNMLIHKWWVPLFEKYGLTAAFEHHDHTYKRTHLIKNNKIDPEGVLYIGDGSWGIEKPREPHSPAQLWYLARSASVRQVVLVTLRPPQDRLYQAVSSTGLIIDEYRQF